jgi:branched-chain amino acid aminotransferase
VQVGNGRRGQVTEALQRAFFELINGKAPDTHEWLTYVYPEETPLQESVKAVAGKSR